MLAAWIDLPPKTGMFMELLVVGSLMSATPEHLIREQSGPGKAGDPRLLSAPCPRLVFHGLETVPSLLMPSVDFSTQDAGMSR